MISDNFVTGDNVYLNELKNFFFEVLGMMSITHYGCIGDGRYDNYGPLQVAIEDAHRRGLKYIYVPGGRYRFRGNLLHLEGITFVGNSHAKIYNDKTGVMIPIVQFALGNNSLYKTEYTYMLNRDFYIDLSGEVGDKVSLIPMPGQNVAYYCAPIHSGEKYEFAGKGTMAKLNNECEIAFKYDFESSDPDDIHWFVPSEDGIFVISYTNIDEYEPHLWHMYNLEDIGIQPLLTAGENITIENNVISATGGADKNIITATLRTSHRSPVSSGEAQNYEVELEEYNKCGSKLSLANHKVVIGNGIKKVLVSAQLQLICGSEPGTFAMWITLNGDRRTETVAYINADKSYTPTTSQILLSVEEGDEIGLRAWDIYDLRIIGNSNNALTYLTVEAVEYDNSGPEPGPEEDEMRKLTESVALVNGTTPPFEEGFYYTANNNVTVNGTVVFGTNEILYYDADRAELAGSLRTVSYSNDSYFVGMNSMIETTLSQSNSKIPTSSAVYNAINT